MVKECTVEWAYLVRLGHDYYCDNSQPRGAREVATRFFSQRAATYVAEQINGVIEIEILTPTVLRTIISMREQHRTEGEGEIILHILEELYKGMTNVGLALELSEHLTLNGNDIDSDVALQQAASRYADIFHAAQIMLNSYYNIMATFEFFQYDPEVDGLGAAELEACQQLGELYESQILNLTLIWYGARCYLEKAHNAWRERKSFLGGFEKQLKYFTTCISYQYEPDPIKCFKQYLRASVAPLP